MGAKEQEADFDSRVSNKLKRINGDLEIEAFEAIEVLSDGNIKSMCEKAPSVMNALADTIIDHMGRAK